MHKPYFMRTIWFWLLVSTPIWAQKGNPDKAQRFFAEGRKYETERDLERAISFYQKSLDEYPLPQAHLRLGYIYGVFFRDMKDKQIFHYEKCIALAPGNPDYKEVYIYLAEINYTSGNYEKAIQLSQQYLKMAGNIQTSESLRARKIISDGEFALQAMKKPVDFQPVLLPSPLNRMPQQDFPTLTADKKIMFFTGVSESGDENMYLTRFIGGAWTEPEYLTELNTSSNEGTCAVSADGKTLVFAACDRKGRTNLGSCDLYISRFKNGRWERPQNLGAPINTEFWESQPSVSSDGNLIFFSADSKRGGIGGRDIFWTRRGEDGKWTTPQCLDSTINTTAMDISPFIHPNGKTLFFASNGHTGMGGYDLYKSEWKDGKWQKPVNLGYPINNHLDQVSLFITADGEQGYYAQEIKLPNGKLSHKIAVFDIPQEIKIERKSDYVRGKVYDAETQKPLAAKIELRDLSDNILVSAVETDPTDGNYLIVLTQGAHYALHVQSDGYLFESLTFDYKSDTSLKAIEIDIPLRKIKIGSSVTLNNIFFKSGSYHLLEDSYVELRKLLSFLNENPKLSVEISGHTDDVGKAESNLLLSQQRAQSVVSYLIANGLSESRIIARGYGETQPLADNTTEKGRALNRRIEFKILKNE